MSVKSYDNYELFDSLLDAAITLGETQAADDYSEKREKLAYEAYEKLKEEFQHRWKLGLLTQSF